jgi:hypothetical protein
MHRASDKEFNKLEVKETINRHFFIFPKWEQHLAAIFAAGSRSHPSKIFLQQSVAVLLSKHAELK